MSYENEDEDLQWIGAVMLAASAALFLVAARIRLVFVSLTMTIFPTHTCFDDTIQNLIWLMKRDGKDAVATGRVKIAHAIVCPDGEDLPHAWIENERSVWFTGLMNGERVVVETERAEYYEKTVVKHVVRYTMFEAYRQEKTAGHFGPWDTLIRSLTKV